MTREFEITAHRTYKTKQNARNAVANGADEHIRHTFIQNEQGRWFPVFFPTEEEMANTGIHFRWNVIR